MGAAVALGGSFWDLALGQTAQAGPSPYGDLQPPDANGLMLPAGFTSRVITSSLAPVGPDAYLWHPFPDGGACLPTDTGGWIYISNSENPPPADVPFSDDVLAAVAALAVVAGVTMPDSGGVGVIEFDSLGNVVDARSILDGSISNCAGGLTPWGTWLSCEEWEIDDHEYSAGRVFECFPFGTAADAIDHPSLGRFKHEMAACDPVREHVYLSEDEEDGLFYRYVPLPGTWGTSAALDGGTLQAMAVGAGDQVTWIDVAPFIDPTNPTAPIRAAVTGATVFVAGEGVVYDDNRIYLTTKPPDDRVWVYDIVANTMKVLYTAPDAALSGVDNIAVSAAHDLYVAEDGGNLEVCIITPDLVVAPVVRMTGPQHGFDNPTPIPFISEVTGLAFSPDGNRLYFNSERGNAMTPAPVGPGPGILYEVTGPFRGSALAQQPPPTTAGVPATTRAGGALPATGADGGGLVGAAAIAAAAAAATWRLRRRGVSRSGS